MFSRSAKDLFGVHDIRAYILFAFFGIVPEFSVGETSWSAYKTGQLLALGRSQQTEARAALREHPT
jgi:hypothetical protein